MRAYVTILDGDDALLPYFVRHYQRLGATEFPLLVYGTNEHLGRASAWITAVAGRCEVIGLYASETFSAKHREKTIAEHHPEGEWAFFCDLDEFAAIRPQFVWRAIESNYPFVAGNWVDRVAAGGKLADVNGRLPLERQFPLSGRLRSHWGMGDLVYVLSPKAPTLHHPQACRWGKELWRTVVIPRVDVHHFKWQTNVVRRLRRRLERIEAAGKSRTPWADRVKKMLAHLEAHQGIDPSLLTHVGDVMGV
jgi:hypothetical protein